MARAHVSSVCVALCVAASCAKPPTLSVDVSTGQETGALSVSPAVTTVTVTAYKADNTVLNQATATAPDWTFDLGTVNDTNPVHFEVAGFAADKTKLAGGKSVSIVPGAISNGSLSLFMERLGGFSRPDGGMSTSHLHAPAIVVGERYLVLTGGDKAENATGSQPTNGLDGYDLLSFGPATSMGTLTRSAQTIVPIPNTTSALFIDKDGATMADFSSTNTPADVQPPTGLTFADVAGGQPIVGESGSTYVIGATRTGPPTTAVLVVDSKGNLTATSLTVPRAGAAAGYVTGKGVVVVGGLSQVPGVEVIPDDGSAPRTLAFGADPTTGAAIAPVVQTTQVYLAGGMLEGAPAATRLIDIDCATSTCPFTPQGAPAVDAIATRSQAFLVKNGFVVIGDDPSGQTRAFQFDTKTFTELPLRDPRKGATAIPTPNGLLAVLGGELISGGPALSVELLFPP